MFMIIPLLIFGLISLFAPPALQAAREDDLALIESAATIMNEVVTMPESIPRDLLDRAQGIAIFPNVLKAAFLVGARVGDGVIVARAPDGTWSPPSFLNLVGGSFGFQAGAKATDLVLVFMTRRSVEALGRGDFTLGATASVAAGPVGRTGQASTDIKLAAEIFSYSRSRGLFGGLALDGTVLQVNTDANLAMYGSPDPLRQVATRVPPPAARFSCVIEKFTGSPGKVCV